MNKHVVPNESKGLNKRRHAMPQIADHDAFMKDLENGGIATVKIKIDPKELKPTQSEFNWAKVDGMIEAKKWNTKPIITSDDDFVVDGHHRWLAAAAVGQKIECIVIDEPIDDLLRYLKGKPYVKTKMLHEDKNDQLAALTQYFEREARGEGGSQFAAVLNKVNHVRESVSKNPEKVKKNRQKIVDLLEKVLVLCGTGGT